MNQLTHPFIMLGQLVQAVMGDSQHKIASIRGVLGSQKAIKSTDTGGITTWFFQNQDREYVAFHENAGRHTVDFATIRRNVNHKTTDIETTQLEDTPFTAY